MFLGLYFRAISLGLYFRAISNIWVLQDSSHLHRLFTDLIDIGPKSKWVNFSEIYSGMCHYMRFLALLIFTQWKDYIIIIFCLLFLQFSLLCFDIHLMICSHMLNYIQVQAVSWRDPIQSSHSVLKHTVLSLISAPCTCEITSHCNSPLVVSDWKLDYFGRAMVIYVKSVWILPKWLYLCQK